MKIKKLYKYLFLLILLLSIISTFGFIIFYYIKSINTVIEENNGVEEVNKPPVVEKSDFVKKDLKINFNLEQKIFIINFSKEKYFILNEFKYYFIIEFNKLGPKNNNIEIKFGVDNLALPKEIYVNYQGVNHRYSWNFKLI
ncbi:hypothetical protein [Spiroplasma cantharicola]|uniref:Uncharacterized protein n=1 Tax=Spiroplasma cantharicola TaxID=362837 RepID=A0A0M3SJI0_9MOLU|nr:hypothetical protein [Spiroplasma cantharicola]ALD66788.1 hypothetical protein SCANT_v1c08820 [Spiroplasma cantharicola]